MRIRTEIVAVLRHGMTLSVNILLLLLLLLSFSSSFSKAYLRVKRNRPAQRAQSNQLLEVEPPLDPIRCPKYCLCPKSRPIHCPRGVPAVTDGCGCCPVCARQQGELCDARLPCDERRSLYCHYAGDSSFAGFCRKRFGRKCYFNGKQYQDAQLFAPDCRYHCRCQDGVVTCVDQCQHEKRIPSNTTCPNARLIKSEDRCCARWICNSAPNIDTALLKKDLPSKRMTKTNCTGSQKYTTSWSKCSVTCGVGTSFRHSTNNVECKERKETRLCEIRPCNMDDSRLQGSKCTSTVRAATPMHLIYTESNESGIGRRKCRSLRQYRPKFCSKCRKDKCCQPYLEKIKLVEFACDDGQRAIRQWLWIKRCRCQDQCQLV